MITPSYFVGCTLNTYIVLINVGGVGAKFFKLCPIVPFQNHMVFQK